MDIVERLRNKRDNDLMETPIPICQEAATEIESLRRQLEEAKRDAARHNWLMDAICTDDDTVLAKAFEVMPFKGDYPTKEEFNATIDAAMDGE